MVLFACTQEGDALSVEKLDTVTKLIKSWSAFYCHVPTILNNVSDEIILPQTLF